MGTIYENVKELCDCRKVSISKMCVDLGLSKSLSTKLKNDPERGISSITAQKIADYFGVSVDEVLGNKKTPPAIADEERTKEAGLNPDYFKLTPENKALIDRMIEQLSKTQPNN